MHNTNGASALEMREHLSQKINPQDFNLNQAAYSVGQLLQILPLGRTSLYYAIKRGDVNTLTA